MLQALTRWGAIDNLLSLLLLFVLLMMVVMVLVITVKL